MFDAPGPAGMEGAWQWVEIAVLDSTTFDNLWTINDSQGSVIATFPQVSLPANSYLMILLGPNDPAIDNLNPDLGQIAFTSGSSWGDHLGVASGGVQLRHQDIIQDEIYWGNSSGIPHLELSLAAGNILEEGESIGRSADSFYSGNSTDWAIAGGENSNGSTGGKRNIVEPPNARDLVMHNDTVVNSICMALSLSFSGGGWLEILDSQPQIVLFDDSISNGDVVFLNSHHDFRVKIDGTNHIFTGNIETTYTRTTEAWNTSELYQTQGTLISDDGNYSLEIDLSELFSGAHSTQRTNEFSTDFTWSDAGIQYPVSTNATITTDWISDNVKVIVDTRQGIDWGGAGTKTGQSTVTLTRVSDGVFNSDSTVMRSFPSLLPKAASTHGSQSWASGEMEVQSESIIFEREAMGGVRNAAITNYHHTIGGRLWATMEPLKTGSIEYSQSALSNTREHFEMEIKMPLLRGDGATYLHTVTLDGTYTWEEEKEIARMTIKNRSGSSLLWEMGLVVDPPLPDQQQGVTKSGNNPDGNKKPRKKKKGWWARTKQAVVTTVTCVGQGGAAQMAVVTKTGKKAAVAMIGKAAAKKMIPIVGWLITAKCAGLAAGDAIWGD